ncbi:acyl transferase domain-containing protein/NADPH:quinone reductase-like Zn-dependent oxidoreductase/acyl carrier protein [Thermocatellispora tengchongensis]|uniref:Acyl transferase domain-containing protein/NADPH:quinone reductase-like Zn-dependent oxidoreductase/acyl carrier protein n=1 Tax=Thermocatellispora tengchongensis TaxID=1073253 RepID=A0A840PP81_9ACTN|nr:type I polyketide synthase [Thermocatellispora tengchongensis]MBB5139591.1 acyl transferase domain-containing protein/NADPH:quinone reductase-like Zn-dependent oxidoreductase/acyl carrier protein [Thermocatellispora tengchongensis]
MSVGVGAERRAWPRTAVAVVGVGCRLPGGIEDLDGLWQALARGDDLVGSVPPDRFEADRYVDESIPRADRSYTRAGGFLHDVAGFDAAYFGISPKEAASMDPQQRLLLEMAAEAFDDAGIDPATLAGSDTGVFVGISDPSYGLLQALEPGSIGPYTMSGMALSIAANRLSYVFDLRGPSMSIDTACSSSLQAVERACRALADGSCGVVLAGGVNVLLSPIGYVGFSQASMLSPTGRCRAFSAGADGFVRAEGGGVVVLKRLADALADGDRVHGVIVGAAANNDGRTMGLALPNAEAQEALLRRVYDEAGIAPDEVVYVEAHGTGTQAGDPAECRALGRALGAGRTCGPLPIGSVKSNLGHLEPASGMPGLFKALLVLRHRMIPASLHAETLNPAIDFDGLGLSVVTEPRPLRGIGETGARAVVGVNSFGFGGANVHVAVAAPPPRVPSPGPGPGGPLPFVVSARSPEALAEAAGRAAAHLAEAGERDFYDLAYTAARRRAVHRHRAVVLAGSPAQAAEALARVGAADGPEGAERAATGEAVERGRVALVFCGNGSQWAGMGADLLAEEPFRRAVEAVDAELTPRLGWSVLEELALPPRQWRLSATEVAQPLLFAVQAGLVEMLLAAGVRPGAVAGHSVGEVAAAYAAGALSLPQAAQVIAERGLAQAVTRGQGRMAAVGLPEAAARQVVQDYPQVEVAAVNSGRDVTVAGPRGSLKLLGEDLAGRDVFFRELDVDYPFHSAAMDPIREPLCQALAGLRPSRARLSMVSTVTGEVVRGEELDAAYWWRNVRRPVRFAAAVERLLADGFDVLVEVGPHPVLGSYLRRLSGAARVRAAVVPTLRRAEPGPARVRAAVAEVVAAGGDLDWERCFPRPGAVRGLPAYPWQRLRHWNGGPLAWAHSIGDPAIEHPLLGQRLPTLDPSWHGELDRVRAPWVTDHRAGGAAVMPATGYVDMALAAGRLAMPEAGGAVEVDQVAISRALVVPGPSAEPACLQTSLSAETGVITVASTTLRGQHVREHFRGRVRPLLRQAPPPLDVAALRARIATPVDVPGYYARATEGMMAWGPAFQVLTGLWKGEGEILGAYSCPERDDRYQAHPVILDSALQAGVLWLVEELRSGVGYMPAAIGSVRLWRTPDPDGLVLVRERSRTAGEVCWDITVAGADGRVAAEMEGCRLRRMPGRLTTPVRRYHVELRAAPRPGEPAAPWPGAAPAEIRAEAGDRLASVRSAWRELDHAAYAERLEETFARTLAAALAELTPGPIRDLAAEDPAGACREPHHRRMVRAALPLLERYGLLERPAGPPPDGLFRGLLDAGASCAPQTALAVRACLRLPELLRGECTASDVLAAGGAGELMEQFHDAGPAELAAYRMARALVERIAAGWPDDRPLRVLEVGAGVGGATAALLPVLPAGRTRYTVTDAAEPALARLRQRFSGYDFVDYAVLDLDADPAEQGQAGGHDLVVAAGCLHLTRDLAAALRRLHALLAPGGKLLVAEPHRIGPLLPLSGLTAEFWDFDDHDLRPDSPLLPGERWPGLLAETGYTEIVQIGPEDEPGAGDFSVLLATSAGAAPSGPPSEPPPETPPRTEAGGAWIVAGEDPGGPLAAALGALLEERGGTVSRASFGDEPDEWADRVPPGAASVAFALILDAEDDPGPEAAVELVTRRTAALRAVALACERFPQELPVSLWLVTRPCGALPEPAPAGVPVRPEDAAVWGAARSLGNEQPRIGVRRVCLHRTGDDGHDAARLAAELLAPGEEDEILLTRRGRFVPRLVDSGEPAGPVPEGGAYRLVVRDPGLAYGLEWERAEVPEPGPGQALVEVRAIGLNYRDVMRAVNLLPTDAIEAVFGGHELGLECAGIVTAVGPGVTRLRPGDRVAAAGPVGFGSHAVIEEWAATAIPERMSFAQAATLPMAYATVYHSLHHCARLKAGETVLVHGGAGGVGMAALEYARFAGARVIATAGSPAKRDLLRAMGADHVLDSRSMRFGERVRELTGGRGVDVVLNSLAGEAITRGLECLRHGGRFVELGKRDIFEGRHVRLRPFGDNIAFFGVDVGTLMWKDPALMAGHVAAMTLAMAEGMRPLPHTVYPAERVADAFAQMRHSRHVGKIVISLDPRDEPVTARARPVPPSPDPAATYLVTGGLSGFGAATARHLARRGVRHLALVGRRGAGTPEAAALLAELDGLGARARAYAADAADIAAMRRILDELDAEGHPVRGIVHAAMHLDDRPLTDLDDDRIRAVLRPKVAGALVLDELTADLPLESFVLYSSLTTIGNIGQAPYVAANLHLEALARRRRARGAPALAVALGALAGTGVLSRGTQAEALARLGIEPIDPGKALAAVDDMLAERVTVAMLGRCDWARLRQVLPGLRRPWLAGVLPPGADQDGEPTDLVAALAAMSGEEAHEYVVARITELLSAVMLTPADQIEPDRRLDEYGLDSLMATELLLSMRHRFGVDIPPMELIRGAGTVSDIARTALVHLGLQTRATAAGRTDAAETS